MMRTDGERAGRAGAAAGGTVARGTEWPRRWAETCRLASWLAVALVSGWLLAGHSRAAAAAATSNPAGQVLVLDVRTGGKTDAALRMKLIEWLRRQGLPTVPAAVMPLEFASCAKADCLRALARRTGAQRVLTAYANEPNRATAVWLFDVESGQQHHVLAEWGTGDLWQSLTQTTESLLRLRPEPAEHRAALVESLGRLPRFRLGLSAGLGALGLVGLTVAIAAASRNGDTGPADCPSPGVERACFYDTRALFGPAFALSIASLTGAVLTLSLPSRRPPIARMAGRAINQ